MKKNEVDNIVQAIQYYKSELSFVRHHRRRSKVLNKLSELQRYCNPGEALKSAQLSRRFAEDTGDPRTIGASVLVEGECMLIRGRVEEADRKATEALEQFTKIDYQPGYDDVQIFRWSIEVATGSLQLLSSYQPILDKFLNENLIEKELKIAEIVAVAYYYRGEYAACIEYSSSALQLAKQLGRHWSSATMLWLLGMALTASGKAEAGYAQWIKAYDHSHAMGDIIGECRSLLAVAQYHAVHNRLPEARSELSKASFLATMLSYQSLTTEYYLAEAIVARAALCYEDAVSSALKAYASSVSMNDQYHSMKTLHLLGSIYLILGREREAESRYRQALELAEQLQTVDYAQLILRELATLYEKVGQPEQANGLYRKYISISTIYHPLTIVPEEVASTEHSPQLSRFEAERELSVPENIQLIRSIMNHYPMLTASEAKVCSMIFEQYSNKQIAEKLSLSIRTVENHRYHIRQKLGVKTGTKKIEPPVAITKYLQG